MRRRTRRAPSAAAARDFGVATEARESCATAAHLMPLADLPDVHLYRKLVRQSRTVCARARSATERVDRAHDRREQVSCGRTQQVRLADDPGKRGTERVVGLDAELAHDVGLEPGVAKMPEQLD